MAIINGTAGSDSLTGNAGVNDSIYGFEGNDTIRATIRDYVNGNQGDDRIYADTEATIEGGKGNDTITPPSLITTAQSKFNINGNLGNDSIVGSSGNDTLRGGQDNDTINGGSGDDIIFGDKGNDVLTGGAGIDVFTFDHASGVDTINDFSTVQGFNIDGLLIRSNINNSGITDVTSLLQNATDTASGLLINLGSGNTILLVGVTEAQFDTQFNAAFF